MKTYQDQIQQLTAQCNKWAERCSAYVNAEQTYGTHEELAAQLAAAREALLSLLQTSKAMASEHTDHAHLMSRKNAVHFLSTPSPAADALLEDKARLDWLDSHAPIITYSSGKLNGPLRETIDAARKASTKEGA